MSQVVAVTKKGQATIPKSLREKHKIGRKALVIDTTQGVLVKAIPDPSMERGSLKKFLNKSSKDIMSEIRSVEFKHEAKLERKSTKR